MPTAMSSADLFNQHNQQYENTDHEIIPSDVHRIYLCRPAFIDGRLRNG